MEPTFQYRLLSADLCARVERFLELEIFFPWPVELRRWK